MSVGGTALDGARVLITGATGQVGLPVAVALAGRCEVVAAARFKDAGARETLEKAGVRCVEVNLLTGELGAVPEVDYVLHFAVVKSNDWERDLDGNAGALAFLMEHCRGARAFLHCSSTGIYQPDGHQVFRETDPLGDNHRVLPFLSTYSISKIAAEAVARYGARRWQLPTVIARLNVPYGDHGGWPAVHLEMMIHGVPITVTRDAPSSYNPIHEDDIVAMLPRLLEAAGVPAPTLNWGGDEIVSIEDWVGYLAQLTGLTPQVVPGEQALSSVTVDLSRQHELVGHSSVEWREGMRRMVAALHPELLARAPA
jgi:nucleoside-diphosphate-sugar epimerase